MLIACISRCIACLYGRAGVVTSLPPICNRVAGDNQVSKTFSTMRIYRMFLPAEKTSSGEGVSLYIPNHPRWFCRTPYVIPSILFATRSRAYSPPLPACAPRQRWVLADRSAHQVPYPNLFHPQAVPGRPPVCTTFLGWCCCTPHNHKIKPSLSE